jgi:hypothetical protein
MSDLYCGWPAATGRYRNPWLAPGTSIPLLLVLLLVVAVFFHRYSRRTPPNRWISARFCSRRTSDTGSVLTSWGVMCLPAWCMAPRCR